MRLNVEYKKGMYHIVHVAHRQK